MKEEVKEEKPKEYEATSVKFKIPYHGEFSFNLEGRFDSGDHKVAFTNPGIIAKPEFNFNISICKEVENTATVSVKKITGNDYKSMWYAVYHARENDVFDATNYLTYDYINETDIKVLKLPHAGKYKICLYVDKTYNAYGESEFTLNGEDKLSYELKDNKLVINHEIHTASYDGYTWVGVFRIEESGESRRRYAYLKKDEPVEFPTLQHDGKYEIRVIDSKNVLIIKKEFERKTEVKDTPPVKEESKKEESVKE